MHTSLHRIASCAGLLLVACISEPDSAPCGPQDQCLSGYKCLEGLCAPCEGELCSPDVGADLGPSGGTACSEDQGICVDFPPSVLPEVVRLDLQPQVSGIDTGALMTRSRVFKVGPIGVQLNGPAEIRIKTTRDALADDAGVFGAQDPTGPWTLLPGESTQAEARGKASSTSYFVAAKR